MKKQTSLRAVLLTASFFISTLGVHGTNAVSQLLTSTIIGQTGFNVAQIDAQTIRGLESITPPSIPVENEPIKTPEAVPVPEAKGSKAKIAESLNSIILIHPKYK